MGANLPSYVTCVCPHCKKHIEFDARELTEENSIIPCPHCWLAVKLAVPGSALQLMKELEPSSPKFEPQQLTKEPESSAVDLEPVKREGFFCGDSEMERKLPQTIHPPSTALGFGKQQILPQMIAGQDGIPSVVSNTRTQTSGFIIVELQQGTAEWLAWRLNGIGASDASTIMGENRFKTAEQLLEEKCGPARDSGKNAAMARGTELEPEARRLYTAQTGRDMRPACLQSTRYDWLRASLDGLTVNCDAVVEIKCGQSAYRTASQTEKVPDYYYGQMQHILAVTGLDFVDFWCYWPGCPPLLIPVLRDEQYIERLLKKELEFWNFVQTKSALKRLSNERTWRAGWPTGPRPI